MFIRKEFINQIREIIFKARENAILAVDFQRVLMYWQIGKTIFEEEQQGQDRATYGQFLIKNLASALEPEFGTSYSVRQLELFRQFYRVFPITNALHSQLNWTQYRLLIRIDDPDKREFYISEATKNLWTSRQMERQINSQLFERLLLSNDKASILAVARGEKPAETPTEIIKDPMVLEFLGLKREIAYYEKDLEQAIITHLQENGSLASRKSCQIKTST